MGGLNMSQSTIESELNAIGTLNALISGANHQPFKSETVKMHSEPYYPVVIEWLMPQGETVRSMTFRSRVKLEDGEKDYLIGQSFVNIRYISNGNYFWSSFGGTLKLKVKNNGKHITGEFSNVGFARDEYPEPDLSITANFVVEDETP